VQHAGLNFPVLVSLRPSWAVLAPVVIVHVTIALALFHVDVMPSGHAWLNASAASLILAVLAGGLVLLSLYLGCRSELSKRGVQIVLGDDGLLEWERGDSMQVCRVSADAVDFGWALWLGLEQAGDRAHDGRRFFSARMMLVAANLPQQDWRMLRIWLRHKALKPDPLD
jgi:hypothetical protein